ncbi:hypothetical protein HYC85_010112 [Camellia sinensis]|uniref:HMG box domain-containing protein n=1 Tax=Camellia sinensis TaxID=4442 RepID=A0A7J7HJM4_CAMSI|nr:hypothetical protein HYC85_010112 [Camellia sinensis]
MASENEKLRPVIEINGSNLTGSPKPDDNVAGENSASQPIPTHTSSVDSFFDKLSKLNESSGLSLLVLMSDNSPLEHPPAHMQRQGTCLRNHQVLIEQLSVSQGGRWSEVASTLNSKSTVSMSPIQLQRLYASLLYQFEQIYHYRTPVKVAAASGHPSGMESGSIEKRKHCDSFHLSTVHCGTEDGPTAKKKCNDNSNQLSTGAESAEQKKPVVQTSPKNKDVKKDPKAPIRARTAYQIFLRKECERLKKVHGEGSANRNLRTMAIDAWRILSESDRQPYLEEFRKDKERFNQEMTAYKEQQKNVPSNSKPIDGNSNVLRLTDGEYHVTLQSAPGSFFVPDESVLEIAMRSMKNARPNDPIFQINWDEYCGSLDTPS